MGQLDMRMSMEPGEAAAVTQIFEQGAGLALSSTQRMRVQQIVLALPPSASVVDFVAATERQPDLVDFAVAVRRYFAEACAPKSP
ncbi:MAG: hypothetical protein CVV05_09530 [Gammaproteobacteria bacterium HGW-Gammaproteobacteria-1]|jgi:hypothetical protein|nr:MAG: hypothetical protein CVV05_09530 [Gammaproteobacteria bacterium HGW-Gammaproteobacteria-1]